MDSIQNRIQYRSAGEQMGCPRVLYSFPHRLGADRICYTALQQVNGLADAGAELLVFAGSFETPVSAQVRTVSTLAAGRFRMPYSLLGSNRAFAWHDYIVSREIRKLCGSIDIVHVWPLGALRTLRVCRELRIPTVLERPNAHTQFAMDVVREECERLGLSLPADHEHAYNSWKLRHEMEEYLIADRLLCPSDFVMQTFLDKGFPATKLVRHQYGFDETKFYPDRQKANGDGGLTVLFAGGCSPRKGLHFALEAWFRSTAHERGTFLIAGAFVPGYAEKLCSMLGDSSVHVLGHRRDIPELMRKSDILILPSIEEGSALVTSEARGSGCVLLVSEAAGATCKHGVDALVHQVGDVESLTEQISLLDRDRVFLNQLRTESLRTIPGITWRAAGARLLDVYGETVRSYATSDMEC